MVKQSTGKTISEHVFDSIEQSGTLKQSYIPQNKAAKLIIVTKDKTFSKINKKIRVIFNQEC